MGLVQKRLFLGNIEWGVLAPTSSWGFRLVVGGVEGRPISFGGISRIRASLANVGGRYH